MPSSRLALIHIALDSGSLLHLPTPGVQSRIQEAGLLSSSHYCVFFFFFFSNLLLHLAFDLNLNRNQRAAGAVIAEEVKTAGSTPTTLSFSILHPISAMVRASHFKKSSLEELFGHNSSLEFPHPSFTGSWQFVANVFPDTPARPRAIYYRPKIRYNPATRRYVFWINGVPDGNFAAAFYVSASSPNPEGPFTIASTHVPVYNSAPGDFDIFMDDDGAGYLIYTSFFTVREGHLRSDPLPPSCCHPRPFF